MKQNLIFHSIQSKAVPQFLITAVEMFAYEISLIDQTLFVYLKLLQGEVRLSLSLQER